MRSGVYQIYNNINGKRYIGSSINVDYRLKTHYSKLKNNNHCNCHLQYSWNKYGNIFKFELIEECTPEECLIFEQYYIDYYESYNREKGYNIDRNAKSAGKKLSEETKLKLSIKAKGRKRSAESIEKTRIANTGMKKPKQSKAMKDRWSITKEYFGLKNLSDKKLNETIVKISNSGIERYKDDNNVINNCRIMATFDDGSSIEFRSLHKAANYFRVDRNSIKNAIKRNNGYIFRINIKFEKV